jgi:hypothetical protein
MRKPKKQQRLSGRGDGPRAGRVKSMTVLERKRPRIDLTLPRRAPVAEEPTAVGGGQVRRRFVATCSTGAAGADASVYTGSPAVFARLPRY